MASIVVLDARPLWQIVHPRRFRDISDWADRVAAANRQIVVPEVVDYEVRRGLLRIPAPEQLRRLDEVIDSFLYSPITTEIMREAAEIWADARRRGRPFSGDERLDADAILIATAQALGDRPRVVVITENVDDFGYYVEARNWQDFEP